MFIPLAEEIGLINRIGAHVLEDACSLIGRLPSVSVAVNESAFELASAGYPLRGSFQPGQMRDRTGLIGNRDHTELGHQW